MNESAEWRHCVRRPVGKPNNNSDGPRISRFGMRAVGLIGGFGAGRRVGRVSVWGFVAVLLPLDVFVIWSVVLIISLFRCAGVATILGDLLSCNIIKIGN